MEFSVHNHTTHNILPPGATASWRGMPMTPSFAPAKFAQRALTQSLARDLAPQKIHVYHVVIDGMVDIPSSRKMMPDKPQDEWLAPDQIAAHYLQLAEQPWPTWSFEVNLVAGAAAGTMATI